MSFFRRLYLRWLFRDTPPAELYAMLDLLQMGLRRCAYDLRHATSELRPESFLAGRLRKKCDHWLKLSNPKGFKEYHAELYGEIDKLERELKKCREVMGEHGLYLDDDMPF